jgi:hypothetical protein
MTLDLDHTHKQTCFRNLIHFFAEEEFNLSIEEIEYVFNDVLEQVSIRKEREAEAAIASALEGDNDGGKSYFESLSSCTGEGN